MSNLLEGRWGGVKRPNSRRPWGFGFRTASGEGRGIRPAETAAGGGGERKGATAEAEAEAGGGGGGGGALFPRVRTVSRVWGTRACFRGELLRFTDTALAGGAMPGAPVAPCAVRVPPLPPVPVRFRPPLYGCIWRSTVAAEARVGVLYFCRLQFSSALDSTSRRLDLYDLLL